MTNLSMEVKSLHKVEGNTRIKAFADVAILDLLLIKGVRIVEGKHGLFVSMPREQGKDGQWYPIVFPLSGSLKHLLDEAVLRAYSRPERLDNNT
ncbi:MAG: SpoVG family protein [Candidatus Omnitrophota bacterium]